MFNLKHSCNFTPYLRVCSDPTPILNEAFSWSSTVALDLPGPSVAHSFNLIAFLHGGEMGSSVLYITSMRSNQFTENIKESTSYIWLALMKVLAGFMACILTLPITWMSGLPGETHRKLDATDWGFMFGGKPLTILWFDWARAFRLVATHLSMKFSGSWNVKLAL